MSYSANIIIEEKDKPVFRKSGSARVVGQKIIFEAEGKAVEMPIQGCEITLGGTGNKQAYVTNALKKDVTLQLNQFGIFSDPAFDNVPAAQKFKKDKNTHNTTLWGSILVAAIICLLPIYMIFIERDYLVSQIVERVPPEYDVKLGNLIVQSTLAGEITDADIIADLNTLVAPLVAAAKQEPFEYKFHIVASDVVNAYALPGGNIIINSALIKETKRPEELLGVLAHEMAHVNERHSMKRIMHSVSVRIFFILLGADPNLVIATLADQADFLASRGYSRDSESEADREGFDYMMQAGIDPSGLQGFFEILKEEESAITSNRLFALASTHPLTDDRIDDLQQMIDNNDLESQKFPPISIDYEDFKDKVLRAAQSDNSALPSTQTEE